MRPTDKPYTNIIMTSTCITGKPRSENYKTVVIRTELACFSIVHVNP